MNSKTPLEFQDVYRGLEVINEDVDEGIIVECDDSCNVLVEYDSGGHGMYCLNRDCIKCGLAVLYSNEKLNDL